MDWEKQQDFSSCNVTAFVIALLHVNWACADSWKWIISECFDVVVIMFLVISVYELRLLGFGHLQNSYFLSSLSLYVHLSLLHSPF